MTHDPINSPSHYAEGRSHEPIDVIEDWQLSYRLGNTVKYISRAGRKNCAIEDLKKAAWYLNREIESLEAAKSPYSVTYEDVLQDYAACATEGAVRLTEPSDEQWDDVYEPVPRRRKTQGFFDDFLGQAEWDSAPAYSQAYWDEQAEKWGQEVAAYCEFDVDQLHKDLEQFEKDEIVRVFERRGLQFGVDKLGKTYILGVGGISE